MINQKGKTYHCNNCGASEFIPDGEFGIRTSQIKGVICDVCLCPHLNCKLCRKKKKKCKGHKYKMKEITHEK